MKTKPLWSPFPGCSAAALVQVLVVSASTGDPVRESPPPTAAWSLTSWSSTTETNPANFHVPTVVGIGEEAESLDSAAAEPGSMSTAETFHVYERVQQTVHGVIL